MHNLYLRLSARWTRWPRLLAGASMIALLMVPAHGEKPSDSLRHLLTPDEFHRAGLDKLTPDELDFLGACLTRLQTPPDSRNSAPPPPRAAPLPAAKSPPASAPVPVKSLPQGEAAFGAEEQLHAAVEILQAVPSVIRSRTTGDFSGWSGRTEFQLENGQVWRQVEPGQFSVSLTRPHVVIEKGLMGAFYLHVEGYGSRVRVKRVK